jgi:hypothetical protein
MCSDFWFGKIHVTAIRKNQKREKYMWKQIRNYSSILDRDCYNIN